MINGQCLFQICWWSISGVCFMIGSRNFYDFAAFQEVEPKLKYERIGNDLTGILSKDAASCMAVHPKVCSIGTLKLPVHVFLFLFLSGGVNFHRTSGGSSVGG